MLPCWRLVVLALCSLFALAGLPVSLAAGATLYAADGPCLSVTEPGVPEIPADSGVEVKKPRRVAVPVAPRTEKGASSTTLVAVAPAPSPASEPGPVDAPVDARTPVAHALPHLRNRRNRGPPVDA